MVADSQSFSPSSLKPKYLAERLECCENVEIQSFEPATREQLLLSHSALYVDGVLDLQIENGFGNKNVAIRDALPYIVGAEIAAVEYAAKHRTLAWALCSGFHHAHFDSGAGFCTFDGLSIASQIALAKNLCSEILIIDGDAHFGDGTIDILERKFLTERIHYIHIGGRSDYQELIEDFVDENGMPELVIFQDGMDAYYLDPIGGGLTYAQLLQRTTYIANRCKASGSGLAANLAGGYLRFQHPYFGTDLEPVLVGHLNAIKASAKVYGVEIPEYDYVTAGLWETKKHVPSHGGPPEFQ